MMRSLFAAVSGLRNHQTRMDVVGNNIANVNTVGYKAGRVNFQDVLSQTIQGAAAPQGNRGGVNPMQVGLGMGVASIDTMFTDGSYQPTGKQTDLSIKGQGFFVLADGASQLFTRAGNFDFDRDGNYLVPGTGLRVMGWTANDAGVLDSTGPISVIKVPVGATMAASATNQVVYVNNLSGDGKAGTVVNASTDTYDSLGSTHKVTTQFYKTSDNTWLAVSSVDGAKSDPAATGSINQVTFKNDGTIDKIEKVSAAVTPPTATSTATLTNLRLDNTSKSEHSVCITTFDANGNPSVHNITFTNTGADQWSWSSTKIGDKTSEASGNIAWNGVSKTYDTSSLTIGGVTVNLTFPPDPADPSKQLPPLASGFQATPGGTYTATTGLVPFQFNPGNGADPVSINLDFTGIRQFGGESTVQAGKNGYAAGTLETPTIDTSGIIVGKFSNGQTKILGQIALATFNNPGGLNKVGDNLFVNTVNSGDAQIGTVSTGGRGSVTPGTLEMSNVDLANEFSNMIITQRGFQANSKIITTVDEMLQELANLKR